LSNDERLLPTVTRMTGGEVLRVMGADGKRMTMPLNALLDAAEARFATRAGEAGLLAACWQAIYAQRDDIAVLKARILVLEAQAPALAANVTALAANVTALVASVSALTARVSGLESEIKTKKDK
jgi:cell division protein FtsB